MQIAYKIKDSDAVFDSQLIFTISHLPLNRNLYFSKTRLRDFTDTKTFICFSVLRRLYFFKLNIILQFGHMVI